MAYARANGAHPMQVISASRELTKQGYAEFGVINSRSPCDWPGVASRAVGDARQSPISGLATREDLAESRHAIHRAEGRVDYARVTSWDEDKS